MTVWFDPAGRQCALFLFLIIWLNPYAIHSLYAFETHSEITGMLQKLIQMLVFSYLSCGARTSDLSVIPKDRETSIHMIFMRNGKQRGVLSRLRLKGGCQGSASPRLASGEQDICLRRLQRSGLDVSPVLQAHMIDRRGKKRVHPESGEDMFDADQNELSDLCWDPHLSCRSPGSPLSETRR